MTGRTSLLLAVGVALGLLGGVVLSQSLFESRVERMLDEKLAAQLVHLRALAERQAVTPPPVVLPGHGEELRRIREQLEVLAARQAPAGVSSPSPAADAEVRPSDRPPTAAQAEASQRAQVLLNAALARGRWTEEDEVQFQRALNEAPPGRMEELASSLSQAINSGQLRPVLRPGGGD